MAEAKEKLFSEFAPISTEEWMAKITADLKGVPFEKKLVWKTGEGFNANPFYRLEDLEGLKTTDSLPGEFPYVRGTKKNNDWYVRQNIEVDCPKAANEKALDVLEKGITSLGFIIKGDDVTPENIATLLDGICPACVELNFNTCLCKAEKLITILAAYFTSKGVDLAKCQGSVNYDPFKKRPQERELGGNGHGRIKCRKGVAPLSCAGSQCIRTEQCWCIHRPRAGLCVGLG